MAEFDIVGRLNSATDVFDLGQKISQQLLLLLESQLVCSGAEVGEGQLPYGYGLAEVGGNRDTGGLSGYLVFGSEEGVQNFV
ncbi:hypothetical protein [Pseudomonas aeruginosa]|uniref:hypothetical protein n=1 Tax=Pseudomonas aeruginosa TaxID=287 RepID=UPI001F4A2D01|nr:hypothetical protein [Pseudomonas aeruginosa]